MARVSKARKQIAEAIATLEGEIDELLVLKDTVDINIQNAKMKIEMLNDLVNKIEEGK